MTSRSLNFKDYYNVALTIKMENKSFRVLRFTASDKRIISKYLARSPIMGTIFALVFCTISSSALASESMDASVVAYSLDNILLFICAVLVLFMQAGFAALEAGMSPNNNTINIMFKNFTDLCVGVILFYFIGFSIMYGDDASGGLGLFGWGGFGVLSDLGGEASPGALHPQVDWLFQVAFAATAATIVSGAVVGRMQLRSYVIYSVLITALVYPISGFWKWGGGWLDQLGFYDFAGSIVVHAVGGFAALAAAIVIGPRIGRFTADSEAPHLSGHSLAMASLGVFILWIGWYGFNPGSQLAFTGEANIAATMLIAVNTTLAAAAGALAALVTSRALDHSHKVSLAMLLNGVLAGLVGITANCDSVTNGEAIIIGLVAGVLVVLGVLLLVRLKIDDAVGAWPVHGLCGIWGGLATGIFGDHDFFVQAVGSIAIAAWAFATMYLCFRVCKAIGWLRVSREEELAGLDLVEHGEIEGEIEANAVR
jgi:Amt family ammonium transporter